MGMSRYIALGFGCVPSVDLEADSGDATAAHVEAMVAPEERRRLKSYHPPAEAPAHDDEEAAPVTLRMSHDAQRKLVLTAFADDEITDVNVPTSELLKR